MILSILFKPKKIKRRK